MPESKPALFFSSQYGLPTNCVQCDCACPSNDAVGPTTSDYGELETVRRPEIFEGNLVHDYRLLFNPAHGRDVVVLNPAAYDIWERFDVPYQLSELDAQDRNTAQQMLQLGLLEPVSGVSHTCKPEPNALSVWLHVTNACNLRCAYCYVSKSNEHMSLKTGLAAIEAVFRSALLSGFQKVLFKFSGGEPTIKLDLVFRLFAHAQSKAALLGLSVEGVILSNGAALEEKDLENIRAQGLRLMLSLDGLDSTHDRQRPNANGKGSFNRVWRTMQQSINVGLKPFISVTVTEQSARDLPDLVGQLLALNLPFNLNFARPVGAVQHPVNAKIIPALLSTFLEIEANPPDYSLLGSLLDRAFFTHPHERPCGVGDSYLVVNQRGQFVPCHMVLDEAITDIHAVDPLSIIRHDIGARNPSVDNKDSCQDCQWRYICAGGCPLTAFHVRGRYNVPSPFCEIYRALFPELLQLEGLRIMKQRGLTFNN